MLPLSVPLSNRAKACWQLAQQRSPLTVHTVPVVPSPPLMTDPTHTLAAPIPPEPHSPQSSKVAPAIKPASSKAVAQAEPPPPMSFAEGSSKCAAGCSAAEECVGYALLEHGSDRTSDRGSSCWLYAFVRGAVTRSLPRDASRDASRDGGSSRAAASQSSATSCGKREVT